MREFIKKIFSLKPKTVPAIEAPYKVETPAPVVDVAPVPAGTPLVNDAGKVVAIADGKPAKGPKVKKAPAAKKAKTTKQIIEENPNYLPETKAKKPRAPRKPKTV
jgi:hypothetical protein